MKTNYSEWLKSCTEYELFTYIYSLGGTLWAVSHDLADDRFPSTPEIEQWLIDTNREMEQGVDSTTRFGIALPRTKNGATEEYWTWYIRMKKWYAVLDEEQEFEYRQKMPWIKPAVGEDK